MAPIDDSHDARITPASPANVAELLNHAWQHDLAALKPLLRVPGPASVQDPKTGETPLHAAIRACGPAADASASSPDVVAKAAAVVSELFMSGAIWNDVDSNNETPGCVAARLGLEPLYTACMEAGVRAELLFGLLDGYEELESEAAEDEMLNADEEGGGDEAPELTTATAAGEASNGQAKANEEDEEEETNIVESDPDRAFKPPTDPHTVTSRDYLQSSLTYTEDGKLLDSSDNGVMMAWETSIMRASVDSLLTPALPSGKKILNIGFGMGIVDSMFAATSPARHHIIEAHPAVLEHIRTNSDPTCSSKDTSRNFGASWEAKGSEEGAYKVHAGRWQDIVPQLMEAGETYDAVYFDTFGEDYAQLRHFFTEHVPYLLTETGAFGFFNGLGADRKICYDVYTRVAEMHLSDAGLDVEWQELDVDMKRLGEEGKGDWEGVKRRYWTLDKYRLPRCTLMG
ncbi:arginine N-methyltransferase 2 [Microdochium trichocladiopsis]|uniref:Arginine N-methyltransferase 2 n=1 Tax=Microdochium trichocladiopsis TaxID=1682393 RepID=A0A9P8YD89_9PEZI|nr:arginine N-methyltransferase 2 [Microdochium trichocladiopsis]KAH7034826.1 arginine N-methyltransferase 2 [Microdochium trichocladiopsis]